MHAMTSPSYFGWRINTPHVAHETIDGEVVVVNLSTGSYYSLDRTGADIWALIEVGAATDEIVGRVGQRYEGACSEMEQPIIRFIDELQQEGLITGDRTQGTEQIVAPGEQDEPRSENRAFEMPVLRKYDDMQELILLDPIHEVDETGWPDRKPEPAKPD